MLAKLKSIIDSGELLRLIGTPEIWNSLDIDYHPPRVERIWCQYGKERIYLHIIHPCKAHEALYHHHPWKSAMWVISGRYQMGVGYQVGKEIKTVATVDVFDGMFYEMIEPTGMHYVRPVDNICVTIMMTGETWDLPEGLESPKSGKGLENLPDSRKEEIRLHIHSLVLSACNR